MESVAALCISMALALAGAPPSFIKMGVAEAE